MDKTSPLGRKSSATLWSRSNARENSSPEKRKGKLRVVAKHLSALGGWTCIPFGTTLSDFFFFVC